MSGRVLSRPRLRVLELAGEGQLRIAGDGRTYAVGGHAFSRQSLTAARRAGEVELNVVTGVLHLTDLGRERLRGAAQEGARR